MSDLARLVLAELRSDPGALTELRELLAIRIAPDPSPALINVVTAAKMLGVHPKTVRRRISEGALPAVVEHGRVMLRSDELRAYIEGLERPGGSTPRRRTRRTTDQRFDFLRE